MAYEICAEHRHTAPAFEVGWSFALSLEVETPPYFHLNFMRYTARGKDF